MTNVPTAESKNPGLTVHTGPNRRRSSSILKVEQVDSSNVDVLDQGAYSNFNAEWVNRKGAWAIHIVLILAGKVVIDTIPDISQNISWTTVNLSYLALSYLMFHWVTGIPFQNELHGGAYDDLTLWEQIDGGAQYTPAKKWLFSVPVGLFLLSTHYTNYNPWLFAVNLSALVWVLIPKLPIAHRSRLRFLPEEPSNLATPTSSSFPPSGTSTPPEGFVSVPPPRIHVTEAQFR
ncbi:putative ORM1-unfolded protein response protein [Amylostereum chailletii]|nr:putative ORM1-unfolded protein response protein [Amylostereum chailletii]